VLAKTSRYGVFSPPPAGEGVASRRKWQASRYGLTGTLSSGNGGEMKRKAENAKIPGPTLSPQN
jgi:hypothetical protein